MSNYEGGQACGCDPACNHKCQYHVAYDEGYQAAQRDAPVIRVVNDGDPLVLPPEPIATFRCGCASNDVMCERHRGMREGAERIRAELEREMEVKLAQVKRDLEAALVHTNGSMDEAWRLTHSDRRAAYGSPEEVFRGYALMWTGLLANKLQPGVYLEAVDVTLMMTALKLAREANSRKGDNVVDAHGYLILHDEILGRA